MVLYEVDSRGRRRESWGGLRDSAVLGSHGRAGRGGGPQTRTGKDIGDPYPASGGRTCLPRTLT